MFGSREHLDADDAIILADVQDDVIRELAVDDGLLSVVETKIKQAGFAVIENLRWGSPICRKKRKL